MHRFSFEKAVHFYVICLYCVCTHYATAAALFHSSPINKTFTYKCVGWHCYYCVIEILYLYYCQGNIYHCSVYRGVWNLYPVAQTQHIVL